jgi:uncharacterized protein with GYD domain
MGDSPVSYVVLMKLTAQGAARAVDMPTRFNEIGALVTKLKGRLDRLYLTMGEYDLVASVDLPDDETAMTFSMTLTQGGFVTTTTMKAFEIDAVHRLALPIHQ